MQLSQVYGNTRLKCYKTKYITSIMKLPDSEMNRKVFKSRKNNGFLFLCLFRLRLAEDELANLRSRDSLVDNYERQLRRLRDDIAVLTGRKDALLNGY